MRYYWKQQIPGVSFNAFLLFVLTLDMHLQRITRDVQCSHVFVTSRSFILTLIC